MRKNRIFAIGLVAAFAVGAAGCGTQTKAAPVESAKESVAETPAETEAAVIETVDGTIESLEETQAQALEMVKLYGPVSKTEDGRLSIDSQGEEGYTGEIILNISEETLILDAVDGFPVQLEDLEDGSTVYAYVGPAMTMSLPPMTTAELIICQIPQDAKAPEYVQIESVVADAASGISVLTTSDGTEYEIGEDCQILPYLTRNIVTLSDLSQGKKCLIWSDDNNAASKIVLFAAE